MISLFDFINIKDYKMDYFKRIVTLGDEIIMIVVGYGK
jgi:hypothetical protein